MKNTTTTTTTNTMTRSAVSVANKESRRNFAHEIAAADMHLTAAYARKLEVLRAPANTPKDEEGRAPAEFVPVTSYNPCPITVLKSARPFIGDDIEDMAAVFCADAVSVTACKRAFDEFICKHNGGTSAPYAEKAAKELLRGCKRVRVDRSSADMTAAEVRDTFNAALPAALYAAFNGSVAATK